MNEMNTDINIDSLSEAEEAMDEAADVAVADEANEPASTKEADPIAESGINYSEIAREDVMALQKEFTELASLQSITELDNPLRYAALRDLGLSPREAYLATAERPRRRDNRAHLYGTPRRAFGGSTMPEADMATAREIFGDLSDSEIRKLYKKVTV